MARNKYPEQTVKRIVETASRLFNEQGYEETSIQDIVDALGNLSKGAIYHHFKSKQAILEAMYEVNGEVFEQIISEVLADRQMNGLQKLQAFLIRSSKNPTQQHLITLHPRILQDSRVLGDQIKQDISFTAPILRKLLVEGIADGSITAVDPEPLSEVLMLLVNTWLNPLALNASPEHLRTRFHYTQRLTAQLGVPIFPDDELLEHMELLLALCRSPAPSKEPTAPTL